WRLVARVHQPAGLRFTAVDLSDANALDAAWQDGTRMVWVETPTNPLLSIVDIAAVAGVARERGALVVVDNTFATPWLQQPLALGHRGPARRPSGRGACAVPGPSRPSGPRDRGQADARLRRHGVVHARRRRDRGVGRRGSHQALHAGRVARRGGVADRAPGPH